MLKRIDNNTIEGTTFLITIPNVHEIHYTEDGKTLSIEIEGGLRGSSVHWYVYGQTLRSWLPPHDREVVTEKARQRILKNISDALAVLGLDYEIEGK